MNVHLKSETSASRVAKLGNSAAITRVFLLEDIYFTHPDESSLIHSVAPEALGQ